MSMSPRSHLSIYFARLDDGAWRPPQTQTSTRTIRSLPSSPRMAETAVRIEADATTIWREAH
jgi:hypothetical protein